MFVSIDGSKGLTEPMDVHDEFKAWVMLAHQLMKDERWDVNCPEATLCRQVFQVMQDAKLRARAAERKKKMSGLP